MTSSATVADRTGCAIPRTFGSSPKGHAGRDTRRLPLNIAALAGLASAPPPPEPKVEGAVSTDTTLTWPEVPAASAYKVWWRRTDANRWEISRIVGGPPSCPPSTVYRASADNVLEEYA